MCNGFAKKERQYDFVINQALRFCYEKHGFYILVSWQ